MPACYASTDVLQDLQDLIFLAERQRAAYTSGGYVLQERNSCARGCGGWPRRHTPAGRSQRRPRHMLGARQHMVVAVRPRPKEGGHGTSTGPPQGAPQGTTGHRSALQRVADAAKLLLCWGALIRMCGRPRVRSSRGWLADDLEIRAHAGTPRPSWRRWTMRGAASSPTTMHLCCSTFTCRPASTRPRWRMRSTGASCACSRRGPSRRLSHKCNVAFHKGCFCRGRKCSWVEPAFNCERA